MSWYSYHDWIPFVEIFWSYKDYTINSWIIMSEWSNDFTQIYVGDQLCGTIDYVALKHDYEVVCNDGSGLVGRSVKIVNPSQYLTLCEVKVRSGSSKTSDIIIVHQFLVKKNCQKSRRDKPTRQQTVTLFQSLTSHWHFHRPRLLTLLLTNAQMNLKINGHQRVLVWYTS